MNTFSITRVGLLLRSEFKIQGREMLIGLASSTVFMALIPLIFDPNYYDEMLRSRVLNSYAPFFLSLFFLAYFSRVHSMVHEKQTLPYVSIPATALEKYIHIILLGVVFYLTALIALQINYWIELWCMPELRGLTTGDWDETILFGRLSLINPFMIFGEASVIGLLYFVGIMLLITILVPKKIYAFPLFFIITIGFLVLFFYTLSLFYESFSFSTDSGDGWSSGEILVASVLNSIGIACLIASYFVLRNKQVKS